jgi:hypothetical protein
MSALLTQILTVIQDFLSSNQFVTMIENLFAWIVNALGLSAPVTPAPATTP